MEHTSLISQPAGTIARPIEPPKSWLRRLIDWAFGWLWGGSREETLVKLYTADQIREAQHQAALAEARRQWEQAAVALEAKVRLSQMTRELDQMEAERRIRELVGRLPTEQALTLLDDLVEIERRLAQLDALKRNRTAADSNVIDTQ